MLSTLIVEIETFDDAINVATVRFQASSLRLAPVDAATQVQTVSTKESENEQRHRTGES